jgi:hypothetical protein
MKWIGMICLLTGVAVAMPDQEKLVYITQDRMKLDLSSGEISFNGELIDSDELLVRAKQAYSIEMIAFDKSESDVTDLFGEGGDAEPEDKDPTLIPVQQIIDFLAPIEAAGINPELVQMEMVLDPGTRFSTADNITISTNGAVFLNRKPIAIGDLSEEILRSKLVSISSAEREGSVNYLDLLAVVSALGPNVQVMALAIHDFSQVQVRAEIYELNADGTTNRLSAPMVTTKSGNGAMIRVVENASGLKNFRSESDEFHQEDLGNLGVRFSVTPQVIGDYIRVSGVAILTKSTTPKEESFQQKGIPYYSYSVTKVVVPFCQVLPPGVEAVEFKVSEKENVRMMCRLSVSIVETGGTQFSGGRDAIQTGRPEFRSN